MTVPWETIIKIYRKQLAEKNFDTLKQYQEDFIAFLHSRSFFTSEKMQLGYLQGFINHIVEFTIKSIIDSNPDLTKNQTDENKALLLNKIENAFDTLISQWENIAKCPEFERYTLSNFETYSIPVFENAINASFIANGFDLSDELKDKIKKAIFYILIAQETVLSYTGLIFSGFGEKEIYPQLISVYLSLVCDDKLRYFINDKAGAIISDDNNASICPFAQTDVIDTILSGIPQRLDSVYLENFDKLLRKYNTTILGLVGTTNPLLTTQINGLDVNKIVAEFNDLNSSLRRKEYIDPLMMAVSTLSKEDLAEMADSLIYLTYLKRRITFAEESVGGPVDVAVISKGDGFIWMKRKQYFKPELNPHFFSNYFKK